jgi:proteasome lid subunit RPN8/RPN11
MGHRYLPTLKRLRLTSQQLEIMRAHVDSCLPLEGCGLLAGAGNTVQEVLPVGNGAHSPVRFRMDPVEQLRAFGWIESNGLDLLGIFHSHPAGPDVPSPTDIAESAYTVVQLIWSYAQGVWKVRGFWIENGRLSDVKLDAASIT